MGIFEAQFSAITWQMIVMWGIGAARSYLAIEEDM